MKTSRKFITASSAGSSNILLSPRNTRSFARSLRAFHATNGSRADEKLPEVARPSRRKLPAVSAKSGVDSGEGANRAGEQVGIDSGSDSELSSLPSVSGISDGDYNDVATPSKGEVLGSAADLTAKSGRKRKLASTDSDNEKPSTEAARPFRASRPRNAKKVKDKAIEEKDQLVKQLVDEEDSVEPPTRWRETYDTMKAMRSKIVAPVDTMGCERLADEEVSERDQRFQTLISLMLSSQTKDTSTAVAIKNLRTSLPPPGFNVEGVLAVSAPLLNELIHPVGFHNNKTKFIKATVEILRDKFHGDIPSDAEGLMSLPGVGPKMAYLCMSAAWGRTEGIGVDVHVHRITNLWGWHDYTHRRTGNEPPDKKMPLSNLKSTKTPEQTRLSLESWLPKELWHEINHMLVGLGQTVCLPVGRKCGECAVGAKGLCPGMVVVEKKKTKPRPKPKKEDSTTAGPTTPRTTRKTNQIAGAARVVKDEDEGEDEGEDEEGGAGPELVRKATAVTKKRRASSRTTANRGASSTPLKSEIGDEETTLDGAAVFKRETENADEDHPPGQQVKEEEDDEETGNVLSATDPASGFLEPETEERRGSSLRPSVPDLEDIFVGSGRQLT